MALGRLLALRAHRFLRFNSIVLCFSYSYVRQTKLVSSIVHIWSHNTIVFYLIWCFGDSNNCCRAQFGAADILIPLDLPSSPW